MSTMIKYTIQEIIGWAPTFSLLERMLLLLHLGLEGITEADTDPKGRFVFFKVTASDDRVLCFYALSGYSTMEQPG